MLSSFSTKETQGNRKNDFNSVRDEARYLLWPGVRWGVGGRPLAVARGR